MELQVQKREKLGRQVKRLRKEGITPAELYGRGFENIHLSVLTKEFKKVFKKAGETTIINLVLDEKKYPALIQDVSFHPVSDEVKSVDFYKVRMDEKIKVKVPLEFVGISAGVKEHDGVLVKTLHEVEVEALPADLPHVLKVDISKLEDVDQSIYVKDLEIPKGVKVLVDSDTAVASINAKVTEEEELAMQEKAAGGVEEVKVEGEEKKKEGEEEAGKEGEVGAKKEEKKPTEKSPPAESAKKPEKK